jgi:taurine--2-oxoglutarate transaminase
MHEGPQRRNRLLTSTRPVPSYEVEKAKGSWIYCRGGKRLLDGSSGLLCVNVGHGSDLVAARVAEQLEKVAYAGPAVFWPDVQLRLAERLARLTGRPNDFVAMATSGTMGVEIALSIAKIVARAKGAPSRRHILTSSLSYHGASAYTLALAGNGVRRPRMDDSFGLSPSFSPPYAGLHGGGSERHVCDASCAAEIEAAIDRLGEENVAALIIEPVNGTTGGAFVPPDGYLRSVGEICRKRGVVVIHDEVLTGLWRCGKALASDHFDHASPDICVLSKGLGAGYASAAAILIAPAVAEVLLSPEADPLPPLGTMATNPLSAAICHGVLDELEQIDPRCFEARCKWLKCEVDAFRELPAVALTRGIGFLYGVELKPGQLWRFMEEVEKRDAFFYPFSYGGSSGFMVAPPLNTPQSDLEYLIASIRGALSVCSP